MQQGSKPNAPCPEGMEEKKVPSALPFYFAAAAALLWAIFLPLYRMKDFGGFFIVIALVFAIAQVICPKRTVLILKKEDVVLSGQKDVDQLISDGRKALERLRIANDKIEDPVASAEITRMEQSGKSIFEHIAKHPGKAPRIRRFMSYYLPTANNLLERLAELQELKQTGPNIQSSIQGIEGMLKTVADAFDRQLDGLFAEEAIDITADLSVLEQMLAQEGVKIVRQKPGTEDKIELN